MSSEFVEWVARWKAAADSESAADASRAVKKLAPDKAQAIQKACRHSLKSTRKGISEKIGKIALAAEVDEFELMRAILRHNDAALAGIIEKYPHRMLEAIRFKGGTDLVVAEMKLGDQLAGQLSVLSELTELTLYDCGLLQPPDGLFEHMRSLIRLDLSFNKLRSIPSSLSTLHNLEHLDLVFTHRQQPPLPDLSQLSALRELYIGSYPEFPQPLCALAGLDSIKIVNGRMTQLPPSIEGLRALTLLDASMGSLESLPSAIGQLRQLEFLYLHGNPLRELPPELCQLGNLKRLSLGGCDVPNTRIQELQEALPLCSVET